MFGNIVLWLAWAGQLAIPLGVGWFVFTRVIPWGKMADERRVRKEIAGRLPAFKARVRAAVAAARGAPSAPTARWLEGLRDALTADAVKWADMCQTHADTVEREYRWKPLEAAMIEGYVEATLSMVERFCHMRDVGIRSLAEQIVLMAQERVEGVDMTRRTVLRRAEEVRDAGVPLAHELAALRMLGNVIDAWRPMTKEDPDEARAVSAIWVTRLRLIADSVELRAGVHRQVEIARASLAKRGPHLSALQAAVDARLPGLRARAAKNTQLGVFLATLPSAKEAIVQAQANLAEAEAAVAEPGTDLGMFGESGRRLKSGLHAAMLVDASLAAAENDLTVLITAITMALGDDEQNVQ